MRKKSVRKYCHVNTYMAYDMSLEDQRPIFKKSFKFLLGPGSRNEQIWKKLLLIFKKNSLKMELKS